MFIDPALLILLLVSVSLISLSLAVIVVSYTPFFRWVVSQRFIEEKIRAEAHLRAAGILGSTRDQAFKIVKEANQQAQAILNEASKFSTETQALLETHLKRVYEEETTRLDSVTKEMKGAWEASLNEIKEKDIAALKKIAQEIEAVAAGELKGFQGSLRSQVEQSQKVVEDLIKAEFDQVKKELDDYKESRRQKIDAAVYEVLSHVSQIVLGRALNLEQQQELVMKALDESERQNGFGR